MKVSPEVEIACNLALREAERRRHDVMTVEHLLFALLHDEATAKVVKKSGGNLEKLKERLQRVLQDELPSVPDGQPVSPTPSRGFQRVLQRAAFHVQSSGKEKLEGHNVLIASFAEPESPAAEAMKAEGVTRYDVVNYVSHGVAKDGSDDDALELSEGADAKEDEDG
ncbi:MAG TPA: Clp protease N-terminal domain-containing protein, partial [Polyangiaceae bacterium]|nr:Clp protease N-terminal domain-containing protein [Polyangiaceae bacterium]